MLRLWRLLYSLPLRFRSLLHRDQVEHELDEELNFYLEERTAHEIELGQNPEQSRKIARLALGGIEQRKEECRDQREKRHHPARRRAAEEGGLGENQDGNQQARGERWKQVHL